MARGYRSRAVSWHDRPDGAGLPAKVIALQEGGNMVIWSSNGDINAGKGEDHL
jgi:hypothetical protein